MPDTAPDTVRVRARVASYDHGLVLRFLRPRAIAGVEKVDSDTYTRALRVGHGIHAFTLAAADGGFEAGITPPVPEADLLRIARTMVGAADDLAAFRAHVASDRILGPLVARRPGVRLIRFPDVFEGIVRGILGQQISLAAAATTAARLAARLGDPLDRQRLRAFPSARAIADADEASLRSAGLTGAKVKALRASAQAIASGALDPDQLLHMPSADADSALRELPGIGPWTASYIRMRALGDTDAFPASDLGVLKALQRILSVEQVSARDAEALAEPWRPWRAYAAIHLWASLSDNITP